LDWIEIKGMAAKQTCILSRRVIARGDHRPCCTEAGNLIAVSISGGVPVMNAFQAGIPEADWLEISASV
jgi:hypothetical protein